MKRIVLSKLIVVVVLMLVTASVSLGAVTRYWVATGPANWNNAANWSATSGTAGGAGVPSLGDDVIFDAGGAGACTINVTVSVGTLTINGYTGTITQAAALTVISTFAISSGTFTGGAFTTTFGSSFSQTGGAFTIGGPTTINGNVSLANGTFTQNATLTIKGSMTITSGIFTQGGALTVYDVSTSTGAFSITGGTFAGATQAIKVGSFSQTGGTFTATSGTTQIAGNADFTSGTFIPNGGMIDFRMGASGPAITITGSPTLNDITFSSAGGYTFFHTVSNNLVANNVTIDLVANSYVQLNIAATGSLRAKGDLTWIGNSTHQLTGGTIFVEKNITLNTQQANTIHPTNAVTIEICGTGDQDLKSNVAGGYNILPNVKVNKPSGTLNLIGLITVSGPVWNVVAGTINPNVGTSTLMFYQPSGSPPITVSGDQTLGDVTVLLDYSIIGLTILNNIVVENLLLNSNLSVKIQLSGTVTVNKLLALSGTGTNGIVLRGGTIYAKGDIFVDATYTAIDAFNTGTIEIVGTGAQTMTGNTTLGQGVLPNIVIDKPSGLLTISNNVTLQGSWTYKQGDVDATSNFSTVYFTNYTNILTAIPMIDGQGTSANMTFFNVRTSNPYPSSVKVGGALQVDGDLRVASGTTLDNSANYPITVGRNFNNAGTVTANGATIAITGDFINTGATSIINTTNATVSIGGSLTSAGTVNALNATYTFDRPTIKSITSTGGLTVNNLVINKPSGSLSLLSPVAVKASGQLTLIDGTIVTAGGLLTLKNLATTTIGNASSYVDGPMAYEIQSLSSRTLNFPIGKGGAWRPAELTVQHNSATAAFTYKGEVINTSASGLALSLPATLERVSGKRYYDFNSNGANNLTFGSIKLYFDADDEVNNLAKLGVAVGKAASGMPTAWTDISAASPTGTCTLCTGFMTGAVVSSSFLPVVATVPGITHQLFALANTVAGVGPNNVLPIELTSFAVSKKQGGAVLTWETKMEKNSDYFALQRSSDGLEFEEFHKVSGQGTKAQTSYYAWTDLTPLPGDSYYRLKQIDFDGGFIFSKVVRFKNEGDDRGLVLYPLPVRNSVVYFNRASSVKVVDNMGLTISINENVDHLDVGNLPTGLYYVIDQDGVPHKMLISN